MDVKTEKVGVEDRFTFFGLPADFDSAMGEWQSGQTRWQS
jgi:hypothetical protein